MIDGILPLELSIHEILPVSPEDSSEGTRVPAQK